MYLLSMTRAKVQVWGQIRKTGIEVTRDQLVNRLATRPGRSIARYGYGTSLRLQNLAEEAGAYPWNNKKVVKIIVYTLYSTNVTIKC